MPVSVSVVKGERVGRRRKGKESGGGTRGEEIETHWGPRMLVQVRTPTPFRILD